MSCHVEKIEKESSLRQILEQELKILDKMYTPPGGSLELETKDMKRPSSTLKMNDSYTRLNDICKCLDKRKRKSRRLRLMSPKRGLQSDKNRIDYKEEPPDDPRNSYNEIVSSEVH